jgi:hypothetical protein
LKKWCKKRGQKKLKTILLGHNYIEHVEDLKGLLECPSIQVLNLEANNIADPEILNVLVQMPNLKCLYLKGNECVKKIRHYRKVLTTRLPQLTFLDDRPVFPKDRERAEAFVAALEDNGLKAAQEAERLVVAAQRQAEKDRHDKNFQAFEEMVQKARAEKAEKDAKQLLKAAEGTKDSDNAMPLPQVKWDDGTTTSLDPLAEVNPHSGEPVINITEDATVKNYRVDTWSDEAVANRVTLAQQRAQQRDNQLLQRIRPSGNSSTESGSAVLSSEGGATNEVPCRSTFGENNVYSTYNVYTDNLKKRIDHLRESGLIDAEAPNPRVKPEGSRVVQPSEHNNDVLDIAEEIWTHNDLDAVPPDLPQAHCARTVEDPPSLEQMTSKVGDTDLDELD